MPNKFYSEFADADPVDQRARPSIPRLKQPAPAVTGSTQQWKMPKTPGPRRRIHKVLGRRVRTMAREDF